MPTTDWNWFFFSSVAQSAAAIVGNFSLGAFIVTKILANQSAYAEKSRRMQELITLGEKLVDATSRLAFEWIHKHDSASEIEDLEKLLEKDETEEPESLYEEPCFSPYIAKAETISSSQNPIEKNVWNANVKSPDVRWNKRGNWVSHLHLQCLRGPTL